MVLLDKLGGTRFQLHPSSAVGRHKSDETRGQPCDGVDDVLCHVHAVRRLPAARGHASCIRDTLRQSPVLESASHHQPGGTP